MVSTQLKRLKLKNQKIKKIPKVRMKLCELRNPCRDQEQEDTSGW